MHYWSDLQRRSLILWRALFGRLPPCRPDAPVFIDRSAAGDAAEHAPPETIVPAAGKTAAEEDGAAGRTMNTALPEQVRTSLAAQAGSAVPKEEVLPASPGAAVEKTPPRAAGAAAPAATRELSGQVRLAEAAGRAAPHPEGKEGSAGAAWLWQSIRAAEQSSRAAAQPAAMPDRPPDAPLVPQQRSSADWSADFERDARRYDGAYDLL